MFCLPDFADLARTSLRRLFIALAEKVTNLATHAFWHLQRERFARNHQGLLVSMEEFDALWTVGQMTIKAFPLLGRKGAAKVVHAVVNQLPATDPDSSFVRFHDSRLLLLLATPY